MQHRANWMDNRCDAGKMIVSYCRVRADILVVQVPKIVRNVNPGSHRLSPAWAK